MAFTDSIKHEALARSRRCCCVCHQFVGIYANVHHIIPSAKGGLDDMGNAIVLCLRCHGEAGHYNPSHPIGNKYSADELRRHRDEWWAWCRDHPHEMVPAENELHDRITAFRCSRLDKIAAGETPVALHGIARLVLHVIPVTAFSTSNSVDMQRAKDDWYLLALLTGRPDDHRYNVDGLLVYGDAGHARDCAVEYTMYTQLFGNGVIEAVDEYLLNLPGARSVPGRMLERHVRNACVSMLNLLRKLQVDPPIHVFLTLTGVKGYTIDVQDSEVHWPDEVRNRAIDRDVVHGTAGVIESYGLRNTRRALRPLFDQVWRAAGWPAAQDYGSSGFGQTR